MTDTLNTTKGMGWIPDVPDRRDFRFASAMRLADMPVKVDLSGLLPGVILDQGQTSSCVGHAWTYATWMTLRAQGRATSIGSRMFAYYNARLLDGRESADQGATIRSGIKGIAKYGIVPEVDWSFAPAQINKKPPTAIYRVGLLHQALQYNAVDLTVEGLKGAIASGRPVVMGIALYESFMSKTVAGNGIVSMPANSERMLGGHAITIFAYDDKTQRFGVINSWGLKWGNKGRFTMPYAYPVGYGADAWTLTLMEA